MTPLNNKNVYDFSKGDPKVFEVFFLHYFPQVKNFISRLIQNEEDAEDLAQDIFAGLWKNRTLLGEVENMNAYLYRSAKNTVFRYIERYLLFKNYQEKSVWTEEILPPSRNQVEEEFRAHELELLIASDIRKGNTRMQLFDLDNDLRELHDVAAQHPDIVNRLEQLMKESHTEPENPKFRF